LLARLLLLAILLGAAPARAQSEVERATVYFDAKPLFSVRGVSALPARERVKVIRERLLTAAKDPDIDPDAIGISLTENGFLVGTPDFPMVNVTSADARLEEVDTPTLARVVRDRVARAIADFRAERTPEGVRRSIRVAAYWTIGYVAAMAALVALARVAGRITDSFVASRIEIWERKARNVVRLTAIWAVIRRSMSVAFVIAGVLASYVWLHGVLLALPWTRDGGFAVLSTLARPVQTVAGGVAGAVPSLLTLALIVALTVAVLRIVSRFFAMVATRRLQLPNFEPEWAAPTERIVRVLIILFAAIMAYPYVPGSSSEAFKAVSIFAGLVFSLGATSVVANMVAGHTLIYRRAFRVGDRISVADVLGDVEAMSAQATYLRTLKNERVTIPNALVLSSQVTNYTYFARERGLILHTEVELGYDLAGPEAEALLVEAARRTQGALAVPAPFVLHKRLGDSGAVYELNVYTRDEKAMSATYSALHASIQALCAERGVDMTTPVYVADTGGAKVPPAHAAAAGAT
jgi:small-conductance mechanosensitive channel